MRHGRRRFMAPLPQRSNVVEDPERPAMRGDDQVFVFHHQIMYRRYRQIELQRLPVIAIVERKVNTQLRPGKKQSFPHSVFANRADISAIRDTVRDLLPRFPEIVRAIDVRTNIIEPVPVYGRVGGFSIEMRPLQNSDLSPIPQVWLRNVASTPAGIPRWMHEA